MKKIVLLALVLVLLSILTFNIQPVKSKPGGIFIRADGSVEVSSRPEDPEPAPITSVDNVTYTFTGNNRFYVIRVERDNIVLDGAGYTLQGPGRSWEGIKLQAISNVTIKNIEIKEFYYGISLYNSSDNSIYGNKITNNEGGIFLFESSNNRFYHNNFINNTQHVYDYSWDYPATPSINIWDDGIEGNLWSDYEDRYPDAEEIDESGIWDTPCVIDENNQDNYPLMNPWTPEEEEVSLWMQWWFWTIVATVIVALAGTAYFLKKRKPPTPTAPTPPTEATLQNTHRAYSCHSPSTKEDYSKHQFVEPKK